MCIILEISSSSYYTWLNRSISKREIKTSKLCTLIIKEFEDSNKLYGSPRITQQLKRKNIEISRPYVARLMKKIGLRSLIRKKYKLTTDSKHSFKIADNLLKRNFSVDGLSQKWVGDITYIKTGTGWLYLTTVIDLADRKVVGWSFSSNMTAQDTTVKALTMAIKNRGVLPGLIFHSDRGVQYACDEFKTLLIQNNITQSMSRKGDCWDNSVAESFFKTLKTEYIYSRKFSNKEIAKLEIFTYIEGFYHSKRLHSALGYKTPNEIEVWYKEKLKLVA